MGVAATHSSILRIIRSIEGILKTYLEFMSISSFLGLTGPKVQKLLGNAQSK